MIMIIGGAYQGKLEYANALLNNSITTIENTRAISGWIEGDEATFDTITNAKAIHGLHKFIWNQMEIQRGRQSDMTILDWERWGEELADKIIEANPDLVIVTDEIGYGIVPLDKKERDFREVTGRVCTKLAAYSTEVHRVICGIGTRIK